MQMKPKTLSANKPKAELAWVAHESFTAEDAEFAEEHGLAPSAREDDQDTSFAGSTPVDREADIQYEFVRREACP